MSLLHASMHQKKATDTNTYRENIQPVQLYNSIYTNGVIENIVYPDQVALLEAIWSGFTVFSKQDISGFSKTRAKHACIL